MGKIVRGREEFSGSSNSAENIKYDDTSNVKTAIDNLESEIDTINSEKFDKAGGTITGNTVINTGKATAQMVVQGTDAVGGVVAQDSNFGLFDKQAGKWLINSDAEGNVLVDGVNVDAISTQLANAVLPKHTESYYFKTAGWYRVAKLTTTNLGTAKGSSQSGLDVQILRNYNGSQPEMHRITIVTSYQKETAKFVNEISHAEILNFAKIRYTVDESTNTAYIEVYYNTDADNVAQIILSNTITGSYLANWDIMDVTPTEETIEGVTVLGEHEFSLNKSYESEVDKINTKLNNTIIPQYKEYIFPTTGWYRIAEFSSTSIYEIYGAEPYIIDLQVLRNFGTIPPESHRITIASDYKTSYTLSAVKFANEISCSTNVIHPKVRITTDSTNIKTYIELYYEHETDTGKNDTLIMLSSHYNARPSQWSLIDMVATEETVDGITVLGEHEFSANKSYETEIEFIKPKVLGGYLPEGVDVLSVNESGRYYIFKGVNLPEYVEVYGYLDVFVHPGAKDTYKRIEYTPCNSNITYQNVMSDGTWSGWTKVVSESDLLSGDNSLKPLFMTEAAGCTDCNDLPIGSMAYTYPTTLNAPDTAGGWRIFTYGSHKAWSNQIAINYNYVMAFRSVYNNETWSDWTFVGKQSDINTINEKIGKTINLFDGNFKFMSFDKSSESATVAGIQEILGTVANTFGIKQVFVHIVFTAGTSYEYWGQVINSNFAVFDEATATLTEKRRYILRNGSWTVTTLAEESDITALQTSVGKLKYEWTTPIKCATWSRLCFVGRASAYRSMYLLSVSITRSSVISNSVFLVNCVGGTWNSIVKISGDNYANFSNNDYSVRLVIDGTGNSYFEIYDDMNGATADMTQSVYCSLIPIDTGNITTFVSGSTNIDGTTIPDGYTVGKSMEVKKIDFQSDVTDRLAYKDISSSIDVGDTGCTAHGYVENGMVAIKIIIPAGTTGQSLLSIDSSYAPRFTINGNVGELSSMSDLIKIGGYINGVGLIYINYTASLAATSTITFTYPLKTS